MDQQEKTNVQKVRSYRGILSAGLRLYINAFRRFFKASWLMALIYALINAAVGTLTAIKVPELIAVILLQLQRFHGIILDTLQPYIVTYVECLVLVIATIIAQTLAQGTVYALLKDHSETGDIPMPASWWKPSTRMMGRTLKGVLCTVICFPLLIIIPFALPLFYVFTKYIMEPNTGYWTTLRNSYGRGMGNWGTLFLVYFLTGLFVILAALIIMLPAHILFLANYQAQMGVLIGDPLGMPSYMLPLTFFTFVLCGFLYFYSCLPLLINGYYAYGSIEAKELEHEQQKLDLV